MKYLQSWVALILSITGCSGVEQAENEKLRRRNCKAERIHRNFNECLYSIPPPTHTPRDPYPWEGNLPRITKEFFRCKGSATHSPLMLPVEGQEQPLLDCEGTSRHGLPVIRGHENVFPILLELLNYVQKKTNKRVIITSGHRCPVHNAYIDPTPANRTSKHQIGAEVDFYVQGMENNPREVLELLLEFYRENPAYKGQTEYEVFQRSEKPQAWVNREVQLKVYSSEEGRNGDNQHPYPYLSIQVRYDKISQENVVYTWKKANLDYPRG